MALLLALTRSRATAWSTPTDSRSSLTVPALKASTICSPSPVTFVSCPENFGVRPAIPSRLPDCLDAVGEHGTRVEVDRVLRLALPVCLDGVIVAHELEDLPHGAFPFFDLAEILALVDRHVPEPVAVMAAERRHVDLEQPAARMLLAMRRPPEPPGNPPELRLPLIVVGKRQVSGGIV